MQAADNFRLALIETVNKVVKMPSAGMPSPSVEGVHSKRIDPNRRLFYEYDESAEILRILDIFDLRQHPSKRKY